MRARNGLVALSAALAILFTMAYLAQADAARKISDFGFMVDSGGVRIVVDTEAACYRGKSKFIPIVVLAGSKGSDNITLTRAAFTLTDPAGKVHPMAAPAEIKDSKNYGDSNVADDYTFIHKTIQAGPDITPFYGLSFQEGTCYFPNVAGQPSLIRDTVELRPTGWTWALLYFANSSGKAKGTYTLTYTDPATRTRVDVPFEINWK